MHGWGGKGDQVGQKAEWDEGGKVRSGGLWNE